MKKVILGLGLLALLAVYFAWVLWDSGLVYAPAGGDPSAKPSASAQAPATVPQGARPKLDLAALSAGKCEDLSTHLNELDTARLSPEDVEWLQTVLSSSNGYSATVVNDYLTCEAIRLRSPAVPDFTVRGGAVPHRAIQLLALTFFDFSARKMTPQQVEEEFAEFPEMQRAFVHGYLQALSDKNTAFCSRLPRPPSMAAFCQWSINGKDSPTLPKELKPVLAALASGQRSFLLQLAPAHRLYFGSLFDSLMGDTTACKKMLAARQDELCQKRPVTALPEIRKE